MSKEIENLIGWLEAEKLDAQDMEFYNTVTNPNEWRREFYSGMRNGFIKVIHIAKLLNSDTNDKPSVATEAK